MHANFVEFSVCNGYCRASVFSSVWSVWIAIFMITLFIAMLSRLMKIDFYQPPLDLSVVTND